jgi:hypothetical protein
MDVETDASADFHSGILYDRLPDIIGNHFFERFALAATLQPDGALCDVWADSKNTVCKTHCWCGLEDFIRPGSVCRPWQKAASSARKFLPMA